MANWDKTSARIFKAWQKPISSPSIFGLLLVTLFVMTACMCLVVVQRDVILVHYYASLQVKSEHVHPRCERWLFKRPTTAMPVLLSHLLDDQMAVQQRAGDMIARMIARHPDPTNPAHSHFTISVAMKLADVYSNLSSTGKREAIELAFEVLEVHLTNWSPMVPTTLATAGEIVLQGLADADPSICQKTLEQTFRIWAWNAEEGTTGTLVDRWKVECYQRAADRLESENDHLRESACRALAGAPYFEFEGRLMKLLDDPNARVRKAALKSIAKSDVHTVVTACRAQLTNFLHDRDPEVRESAMQIFVRSGVPRINVELAARLDDPDPMERAKAPQLAVHAPNFDPIPFLKKLSKDPHPLVRMAVAKAAAESSNPELHAIVKALCEKDQDPRVRNECKQLLAVITAQKKKR